MLAARIELLQQMPIFGGASDETLHFLLEPTRSVSVAAGGFFFREQDPADCMFVLETGRVVVLKQWRGREMLLRHLGPGDCFGEMAMLDLFPRSAAVRAEEDCTAIELTPADLLRLFEHNAEQFAMIQMNIGREMCRRLRTTDAMLFQVTMGEAPAAADTFFQSM
jgi:CRP-like cAMP-binding protein